MTAGVLTECYGDCWCFDSVMVTAGVLTKNVTMTAGVLTKSVMVTTGLLTKS